VLQTFDDKKKAFEVIEGVDFKGKKLTVRELPHVYNKRKFGVDGRGGGTEDAEVAAAAPADGADTVETGAVEGDAEDAAAATPQGKRVKAEAPKTTADVVTPLWRYALHASVILELTRARDACAV